MSDAQSGTPAATAVGLDAPAAVRALATGYQPAQMVYVVTALGIADSLGRGARSAEELAQDTGTHAPSLYRLLRALVAFGILDEIEPRHFALTELGQCLRADTPDSVRAEVMMWGSDNYWSVWHDLLHCVQTGATAMHHLYGAADPFTYYAQHLDVAEVVHAGFTVQARDAARAVLAAYDFTTSGTVVDVGGGNGYLLGTILQAYPNLRGVLYDMLPVVAAAVPILEGMGVADRCASVGGDFFAEIPSDGGVYIFSRVIHDWNDESATKILRTCRSAMAPGATLLLAERVPPDRLDASPLAQRHMRADITRLVRTGGRERTEGEYRALLAAAGFTVARIVSTPGDYSIIESVAA